MDSVLVSAVRRDAVLRTGRSKYRMVEANPPGSLLATDRIRGDTRIEEGSVGWSGPAWIRTQTGHIFIGDGSADAIRIPGEIRAASPTPWSVRTSRPHGPAFSLGAGVSTLKNVSVSRTGRRATISGRLEKATVTMEGPDKIPFLPDRIVYSAPKSLDVWYTLADYRPEGPLKLPHRVTIISGFRRGGKWVEVDSRTKCDLISYSPTPPTPEELRTDYLDPTVSVTDSRAGETVSFTNEELRSAATNGRLTSERLLELSRAKVARGDTVRARTERMIASIRPGRPPVSAGFGPLPYILGGSLILLVVAEWGRRRSRSNIASNR